MMSKKILYPQYLFTDVPEIVWVSDQMYCLWYSDPFAGYLFMATNNLPYYSLEMLSIICFWILS